MEKSPLYTLIASAGKKYPHFSRMVGRGGSVVEKTMSCLLKTFRLTASQPDNIWVILSDHGACAARCQESLVCCIICAFVRLHSLRRNDSLADNKPKVSIKQISFKESYRTDSHNTTEEFSERFQTAFDPLPSFSENRVAIFFL